MLDAGDAAVMRGTSQAGAATDFRIAFGPFVLTWSESGFGRVYLYYDHKPFDATSPDEQRLCVTRLDILVDIDAAERTWVYKAALRDPGCSGSPCR